MISNNFSRKQKSRMEQYLQTINRLPLDKKGKLEFVKAHVATLIRYEEETKENKERFNTVLQSIKQLGYDYEAFQHADALEPLELKRSCNRDRLV